MIHDMGKSQSCKIHHQHLQNYQSFKVKVPREKYHLFTILRNFLTEVRFPTIMDQNNKAEQVI